LVSNLSSSLSVHQIYVAKLFEVQDCKPKDILQAVVELAQYSTDPSLSDPLTIVHP
jgi:hypothetical protein